MHGSILLVFVWSLLLSQFLLRSYFVIFWLLVCVLFRNLAEKYYVKFKFCISVSNFYQCKWPIVKKKRKRLSPLLYFACLLRAVNTWCFNHLKISSSDKLHVSKVSRHTEFNCSARTFFIVWTTQGTSYQMSKELPSVIESIYIHLHSMDSEWWLSGF